MKIECVTTPSSSVLTDPEPAFMTVQRTCREAPDLPLGALASAPTVEHDAAMASLPVGTRVVVRQDPDFGPGPWPAEPTGTISSEPYEVSGQSGPLVGYWVRFDDPQMDADGDGPYLRSQVLEQYLEVDDR